jgi:multiple sugar transport system substrate-binding protein
MNRSLRRAPAIAASILSIIAAVGAVAGCGGSDDGGGGGTKTAKDGPVTLTFANWAAAEEATRPGMLNTIKAFEAAHPNIKIKSEEISFSDIGQQLVLRQRSGNPPDVAELSGNDTFAVAAGGGLATLDDTLGDVKSKLIPNDVKAGTVDGKWVAMPWTDAPQGFWYNKKLLKQAGIEKPPATLEELDAAMAAIKSKLKDVIPLGTDTTNRSFGLASQWPWMKAFGAQPFGEDGKATAATPQMQQYLDWIRALVAKGYTLPTRKIGDFRPLAAQDKVAFIFDQPLLHGVIQTANKQSDDEFYDTWGVTKQPAGPDGQSYSIPLGHQLVLFKKAADDGKAEAAAEFMKFLATDPATIEDMTIKTESSLPPLADPPAEVADLLDTPVFKAFQEEIAPTTTNPAYGAAFSQGFSPTMAGVQSAITSKDPIDAVAAQMQTNLQQAIG